jgi:hypothetical protein
MKTKSRIIATAVIALLCSNITLGQTVDEIVNKCIETQGGKDKLESLKSVVMKGKAIWSGQGMEFPFTVTVKHNVAYRLEVAIQGMQMVQVIQGDSGWYTQPWTGKKDAERMAQDQVKASKDEMDLTGELYNYREKGHTVDLIGKEDMEGTETYKLKLTKKSGDVEYLYVDAGNHYILKKTSKHKFQDKEVEGETLYSDYRKIDGILFPFSTESRQVGQSMGGQVMKIDSVEINAKVDDSIFKMPPKSAN